MAKELRSPVSKETRVVPWVRSILKEGSVLIKSAAERRGPNTLRLQNVPRPFCLSTF